jgi:hypothetical protein
MSGYNPTMRDRGQGGWVLGFTVFAGVMMIMIGIFQAIVGLAAIVHETFYRVTPNYVFSFNVTGWGWVHLVIGVIIAITGFAILAGQAWGRAVGIILVVLSAIANFLFIPYYPLWSILIIALEIIVICALVSYERGPGGMTGRHA